MRPLCVAAALLLLGFSADAQDRRFGGYPCTIDCSGHSAGADWARRRAVESPADCPPGHSRSFQEGCIAAARGRSQSSERDDDGEAIAPVRRRR